MKETLENNKTNDVQVITELLRKDTFDKLTQLTLKLSVILLYTDNPPIEIEDKYTKIATRNKDFGSFYKLNCSLVQSWYENNNRSFCVNESRKLEPMILIVTQEEPQKESGKIPETPIFQIDNEMIRKYDIEVIEYNIQMIMKDETMHLTEANIPYLEIIHYMNTVLFFSNDQIVPVAIKSLAIDFRNKLQIAFVNSTNNFFVDYYKIGEVPKIMAVKTMDSTENPTDTIIEVFTGQLSYENVKEFCEKYALKYPLTKSKLEKKYYSQSEEFLSLPKKLFIFDYSNISLMNTFDLPYALFLFNDFIPRKITKLAEEIRGLAFIYCIEDISENSEIIKKLNLTSNRTISFYFNSNSIPLVLNLSNDLVSKLNDKILDETIPLIEEVFDKMINSSLNDGKIISIYFSDSDTPIEYKLLSHSLFFKKYIKFFNFRDAPDHILRRFNARNLPAISGILPAVGKVQNQSFFHYPSSILAPLLSSYFEKIVILVHDEGYPKNEIPFNIEELNQTNIGKCFNSNNTCLIAVLDNTQINRISFFYDVFYQALDYYEASKFNQFWVNYSCDSSIISFFNLTSKLPTLIAINPSQSTYSSLVGDFDVSSIRLLIKKFLKNWAFKTRRYSKKFIPTHSNCFFDQSKLNNSEKILNENEKEYIPNEDL